LTPCGGVEVHKPTQAPKSVNGLDNTFDLITKWAITVPSGIFNGIFKETPSQNTISFLNLIEVDIWHPAVGWRCKNPPRNLRQLKTSATPFT
jgi:hypothetical protein